MDEGTRMIHPDVGRMVSTAASSASGDAVGCIGVKFILGVTASRTCQCLVYVKEL